MASLSKFSFVASQVMNIQYPVNLGLSFALATSIALLGIVKPSPAQLSDVTGGLITGSGLSDVGGAILTTSDTAGGAFIPGTGRGTVAYRSRDIRQAINRAAEAVNNQLAARNLAVLTTGVDTNQLSPAVQQALLSVLTEAGNANASASQLEAALINPSCSNNTAVAQTLVSSLRGLTAGGTVDPRRFLTAVEAYNGFINASCVELLSDPNQELLAIQSVLGTLLRAAFAAAPAS